MGKKTPIINILTYNLPYKLANQIFNEYQSRLKETNYIIEKVNRYKELQEYRETVELLLALSIFHKRVISNLDGAVKFFGTVTNQSGAEAISIGSYDLTNAEKNKILGLLINYRKLLERYGISDEFMEYYKTRDFLLRLKNLKTEFEYARTKGKESKGSKDEKDPKDDLPF